MEGSLRDFLTYVAGFPIWDISLMGNGRCADALVTVSKGLSREICNHYDIDPQSLFTIHTGVNIEHLQDVLKKTFVHRHTSERTRLFYAGRLYWGKGILHLLKSLSYLNRKMGFNRFELDIFGRGPLERKVRELVARLGLTHNVRMRGFATHEELMASMAMTDIVCFPSLYEACPLGMIEAMALGKPIAAFRRPFSTELLGDGPDVQFARTIEDYAGFLYSLCTSEDLRVRIGSRLQSRARDEFDIKVVAQEYVKVYKHLSHEESPLVTEETRRLLGRT
jgi:glycosyltransferase involved in cell wall biosynthesis